MVSVACITISAQEKEREKKFFIIGKAILLPENKDVQSCDQFAGKLQKDVPARQFEMNEKGILKFSIKTQSAFYLKKTRK
jgi:hypothetical protein